MEVNFSEKMIEILKILEMPKFMATTNSQGEPNVSLVTSWTIYGNNQLVYGDFMTYKTRQNLDEGNHKIGLLIMSTGLDSWSIKADFLGFHVNDEVYEYIAMTPLFRYNQYTNASSL